MKKQCSECKKEMGLFSRKIKLNDGLLCADCIGLIKKVGMVDIIGRMANIQYQKVKEIYENKKALAERFEKDFQLGNMLIIDNTNQLLVIDGVLLEFKNLKDVETKYQYSESVTTNTNSKTKKGIGKSLMGGLIFGPVGAVVGGMTANGKTKSASQTTTNTFCSSAKLVLTLQNYYIAKYYIDLNVSNSELRSVGCSSIEEYGELLEAELQQIIENTKREVI